MRKKLKAPTPQSFKHIVKELDKLRKLGHSPEAVLSRSIMNSWAGVFAVPPERMGAGQPVTKPEISKATPEQEAEAARLAKADVDATMALIMEMCRKGNERQAILHKLARQSDTRTRHKRLHARAVQGAERWMPAL